MTHPPLNDPHMPLEIGQLLKQERLKQGLSIEDLCKKMEHAFSKLKLLKVEVKYIFKNIQILLFGLLVCTLGNLVSLYRT